MVQYFENGDLAFFNGVYFRRDKKTGYFLSSTKPRKRLHVYVCLFYNGKFPKSYQIHHIYCNKNNNEIDNLKLISKSEHAVLHGSMLTDKQKEERKINLQKNATPKAAEWHKTNEGKEWHSKHAKATFINMPFKKYVCSFCGKEFETKNRYGKNQNTFCSNACKSAYRRKMGVDNITKICEKCGSEYIANKYQKTKRCPSCRRCKNRD